MARRTAEVIVAETGADMQRFQAPPIWPPGRAGAPGNNESAGKHRSGKTRLERLGHKVSIQPAESAA